MLIIPRTPSPQPLEERDIATMSQAELAEMQKQFKAIKVRPIAPCHRSVE